MPNFQMSVSHQLSEEEVLRRLHKLFQKARIHLSDTISEIQEHWNGNICDLKFSVFGFHISGRLTVKALAIDFEGELPFLALFFKDKIEAVIRWQAAIILD
ncbi:MAG: polyhydroxyalkanoic acid system family protein [Patescibacteria group bacterium]